MKAFLDRLSALPFTAIFAFFCMYSGASSLFGYGIPSMILKQILGGWFSPAVDVGFAIAGFLMFVGLGTGKRHIEGAGLVTVLASLALRYATMLMVYGLSPWLINGYVYAVAFGLACIIRLRMLVRVQIVMVELSPNGR